jgi:hypothetical protein
MSRNALSGLYIFLGFIALPFTPCVHAGKRPRNQNMDLIALLAEAGQLKERYGQNPSDYETLPSLGIACHALAIKDSQAYTKKAAQCLEKANESKLDDTVTRGYLGSAYTMLAKDSWNPLGNLHNVNKRTEHMDKAVRKNPDNITIRLTGNNNSRKLPKFLNRREIAYEDFEDLAGLFENVRSALAIRGLCV